MALEGFLEDLGIRDILQILSLSKKSGTLKINCQDVDGLIYFLDGQVVRASSNVFPETLGQLLRRNKIVTKDQVNEALEYQRTLSLHQPLGQILVDKFHISSLEIEKVVATQIEKIIFSFFSCTEGRFSFQLGEMKSFGSTQLNPLDFILEKGLSPQRLAVKGQKIIESGQRAAEIDNALIEREIIDREKQRSQQGLDLLRGMLTELEHFDFGGGIILLILRYASEIMNRAIIFDVRGDQLVGLGQFGLNQLNCSADELVRKMRLHVDAGSLFAQALKEKVPIRSALKKTPAEAILREFLNGIPNEVFLGPIVSDGKVVALLYGDNGMTGQPISSAEAFEVFLSQAGLAMEQALNSPI